MKLSQKNAKPLPATLSHVLIALVVVLIFLAPFMVKFLIPDSALTKWLSVGIRVIWFYLLSYSTLMLVLHFLDHKISRAKQKRDA